MLIAIRGEEEEEKKDLVYYRAEPAADVSLARSYSSFLLWYAVSLFPSLLLKKLESFCVAFFVVVVVAVSSVYRLFCCYCGNFRQGEKKMWRKRSCLLVASAFLLFFRPSQHL